MHKFFVRAPGHAYTLPISGVGPPPHHEVVIAEVSRLLRVEALHRRRELLEADVSAELVAKGLSSHRDEITTRHGGRGRRRKEERKKPHARAIKQ